MSEKEYQIPSECFSKGCEDMEVRFIVSFSSTLLKLSVHYKWSGKNTIKVGPVGSILRVGAGGHGVHPHTMTLLKFRVNINSINRCPSKKISKRSM